MHSLQRWTSIGIALGAVAALFPVFVGRDGGEIDPRDPLGRFSQQRGVLPPAPDLEGLELLRMKFEPSA